VILGFTIGWCGGEATAKARWREGGREEKKGTHATSCDGFWRVFLEGLGVVRGRMFERRGVECGEELLR
jgi:hypothetical protein